MNNYDNHRDSQNDSGQEELEESIVAETEDREGDPATQDDTIGEPPAESAVSPTNRDDKPFPPGNGDADYAVDGTDNVAAGPAGATGEALPHPADENSRPSDAPDTAATAEQQPESAHPHEGEYDERGRPQVILEAGTDEESRRALQLCREKVKELHLRMQPLAARCDDDRHVTIFFRADEKVDFRKLVRELSRLLHARIEMRQLGPREQGRLCGLVGKCGYPLCCRTFLGQFAQSSIKMAKTQDLALNPMKISGVCGRLLCCLNYEQELYADVKSRMPRINKFVDTEFGRGRVVGLNVLRQTVTVQYETSTRELSLDQVVPSEPSGSRGEAEGTSATQRESGSSDTEHDTRDHEESPER